MKEDDQNNDLYEFVQELESKSRHIDVEIISHSINPWIKTAYSCHSSIKSLNPDLSIQIKICKKE